MRKIFAVMILAVGIGLASEAWSEPIVPPLPEELAVTRSVVLQESDELEVTPNIQYFQKGDSHHVTPSLEGEYGITDEFELDAEVPYAITREPHGNANGIGDVEVAGRYGVIDSRKNPFALTLGLAAELPIGDRTRDLGDGRLSLQPSFTVSQRLGRFAIEAGFGWQRTVTNGGSDPKSDFTYDVALLYPIRDWYLVLEGNGESNSAQTKYCITPEIVWKAARKVQCFFAIPIGVTHASDDFGIVAGATFEIENVLHRGADQD